VPQANAVPMPGVAPGARGAQGSPVSTKPSVRTGYRYRPERLGGRYDALVVGAGIGGLTAAALLAALGRRVAVLEQHYTAGGATHSFERAGYDWDVGLHYVGDMGARTTLRRMMDSLTMGRLEWAPMDAHYERFFIGARRRRRRRPHRVPRQPARAFPARGCGRQPLPRARRPGGARHARLPDGTLAAALARAAGVALAAPAAAAAAGAQHLGRARAADRRARPHRRAHRPMGRLRPAGRARTGSITCLRSCSPVSGSGASTSASRRPRPNSATEGQLLDQPDNDSDAALARMQARWLRPRTPLAGLWLTGQDIVSCGIGGAMIGGLASALAVVGARRMRPLMKQIFG